MFTPEAIAGYTDVAIFTIINLLVTYFVLKRFLFKPILKVLENRRVKIERLVTDTEKDRAEAEKQVAEANRMLHQSGREAADILSNAKNQAELQREEILADARREASAMVSRADGEIGRLKTSMLNEVRDEVADLSVAIASKVIGKALDEQRQRELVDQFLNENEASKSGKGVKADA